jgi:protein-S-isoprenylcysteine O-methyltransferase Ste14
LRPGEVRKRTLVNLAAFTAVMGGILFWAAGTVSWWNGWAYLAVNVLSASSVVLVVFRKHPGLARERRTAANLAKPWDRVLVPLLTGLFPLLTLILAGLDRRFGWTRSLSDAASLAALAVMLGSSALIFRAMLANPFFSSYVRIQGERGHAVASGGPYAWVRHPGYVGMILYGLAMPVQLGSLVALWVGVATLLGAVVRTHLEDRTLLAELRGYKGYARKVRYRLVPFVW